MPPVEFCSHFTAGSARASARSLRRSQGCAPPPPTADEIFAKTPKPFLAAIEELPWRGALEPMCDASAPRTEQATPVLPPKKLVRRDDSDTTDKHGIPPSPQRRRPEVPSRPNHRIRSQGPSRCAAVLGGAWTWGSRVLFCATSRQRRPLAVTQLIGALPNPRAGFAQARTTSTAPAACASAPTSTATGSTATGR